jgi:hypothetical protein
VIVGIGPGRLIMLGVLCALRWLLLDRGLRREGGRLEAADFGMAGGEFLVQECRRIEDREVDLGELSWGEKRQGKCCP